MHQIVFPVNYNFFTLKSGQDVKILKIMLSLLPSVNYVNIVHSGNLRHFSAVMKVKIFNL